MSSSIKLISYINSLLFWTDYCTGLESKIHQKNEYLSSSSNRSMKMEWTLKENCFFSWERGQNSMIGFRFQRSIVLVSLLRQNVCFFRFLHQSPNCNKVLRKKLKISIWQFVYQTNFLFSFKRIFWFKFNWFSNFSNFSLIYSQNWTSIWTHHQWWRTFQRERNCF